MPAPYEIADFSEIVGVPCPCGTARRAFAGVGDFPGTVHVTEIAADAQLHYHKRLTETYFFLECGPDAQMQLNDECIPVQPGMCIMIRPRTRHRAIGRMKVLILVLPKFDPADEWFDTPGEAEGHGESSSRSGVTVQPVSATRAAHFDGAGHDEAAIDVEETEHSTSFMRLVTSKAFLLAGLMLAAVLLVLALWMPELPRQRAIGMVQAEGGTVYYESELPEWVYGVFGDRLERFQAVYEINLDGTGVDDRIMPHLVNLREAHTVWLNSAEVTDEGVRHLLEFPRITSLDLGGTQITEEGLLPVLRQHRELETVWLQDTAIGDATLEALGDIPTLQSLTLHNTQLGDAGLAHLARLPVLSSVILTGNRVGSEGVVALTAAPSLVDITLESTQVDNDAMAALAAMPGLISLNLASTAVTDEGMAALAASKSLANLNLSGTQVGDAGLAHLAQMPSLSTLSLDGTRVTDEGLRALEGAKHLTDLHVNSDGVTAEGIAQLRWALPDCSVNYDDSMVY